MSLTDDDKDILKDVSNIDDAVEQEGDKLESPDNTQEKQSSQKEFVSQGESSQDRDRTRIIIEKASEAIMGKHRFLTIDETKEIRYYCNGVYVPGGEILIEKVAEAIYGYGLANRHLAEIKGHLMRKTYHQRAEIDTDVNTINLKNGGIYKQVNLEHILQIIFQLIKCQ